MQQRILRKEDYPLHEKASDTLVIQCSDSLFQEAFNDFVREELGIKTRSLIAIPGASQVLTFSDYLPKFAMALLRPLRFLVKEQGLRRVIVIMHEECRWYRDFVPTYFSMKGNIKNRQIEDALAGKRIISEEFPDLEIRMFYAAITPQRRVSFSEIVEKK